MFSALIYLQTTEHVAHACECASDRHVLGLKLCKIEGIHLQIGTMVRQIGVSRSYPHTLDMEIHLIGAVAKATV